MTIGVDLEPMQESMTMVRGAFGKVYSQPMTLKRAYKNIALQSKNFMLTQLTRTMSVSIRCMLSKRRIQIYSLPIGVMGNGHRELPWNKSK